MHQLGRSRTVIAVVAIIVVCGAASASAAKLINGGDVKNGSLTGKDLKNGSVTGKDVKDGSLTGKDVKDGSLTKGDLKAALQDAIPVRVTKALPTKGFSATNSTVSNTSDGVMFGPYADGGSTGGTLCTDSLNGQPLSDVNHLAYVARYTATNDTGGVGVPYLRIFLENDAHDAIFSPTRRGLTRTPRKGPSTPGWRRLGCGGTTTIRVKER